MSRYRKIEVKIWMDAKFLALSDDAQLAFLFLLTHPALTMVGAMRASAAGLAAEKRWPESRMRETIAELSGCGLVLLDDEALFLWLPNFLRYNEPQNPNAVAGLWNALAELPECDLKQRMVNAIETGLQRLPQPFRDRWPTNAKPLANGSETNTEQVAVQEQEQYQEQRTGAGPETSRAREPSNASNGTAKSAAPLAAVAWREQWEAKYPNDILRASPVEWSQLAADAQTLGLDELTARMDRYLASEKESIVLRLHPLRFFVKDVAEYGTPKAPASRTGVSLQRDAPKPCSCGDAYRQSYQGLCEACYGKPSNAQIDARQEAST